MMKDLIMQQQLYQGFANNRIIKVNEEGNDENDPEEEDEEDAQMEFDNTMPIKGGSITQPGSIDTTKEIGNLLGGFPQQNSFDIDLDDYDGYL